ncbi:glutathionylspermidine synthase family protein [Rudanella paleaurantiibacter]|uniref:Glutathionylspermidine synthase family protein n=1 Tax=Rudanella paleaurantiibacter TaxID=2614655 RepID=A0A7J5U0G9_9BACT|nr:glutathionylspermidine synthase family protein [Rudanella paleaurantiibacter]KAB7731248.1 glutathionylspermidine synthase family protein [Rudanella paleaurantiibacter]
MIQLKTLPVSPDKQLRNIGWDWMLGTDTVPYLTNEVVTVSEADVEAYHEAAAELFEMYVAAAQHVIDRDRFSELGIPANLVELIRQSWDDDRQIHLYGRFDLAMTDRGVKLIEFNADTATCLPETAVVQYAHLRANDLDESRQFNAVYETLVGQFRYLREQNPDLDPSLLLSTTRDIDGNGIPEDDANVALIAEAAREAGFDTAIAYIDTVDFSATEGIFRQDPFSGRFIRYDYWFKLVPWEVMAEDEPDLCALLTQAVRNRRTLVLNPAYTLLFQSKYILKVLWELYPNHPLLLRTETRPFADVPSVEKVIFGREGANVRILEPGGQVRQAADGEYGDYPKVYQQYVTFPTDAAGHTYQAGVFYAGEPCGLGFRRGGLILDNGAQFVGHMVG